MNWDLFPLEVNSCTDSTHPEFLKYFRICALLLTTSLTLVVVMEDDFYAHLTIWAILFTNIFFALSVLVYFFRKIDKITCIFFQIIWGINWVIVLIFWGYVIEKIEAKNLYRAVNHTMPFVLMMTEYFFNRISFIRAQFIFPISALVVYFFVVLNSYTHLVKKINPIFDFEDEKSVLLSLGTFIIAYIMLEIGKAVKNIFPDTKAIEIELAQVLV